MLRVVGALPGEETRACKGVVEALSLWAGQSVALASQSQRAAEIVAELVSGL
jgi:hypothetical protein